MNMEILTDYITPSVGENWKLRQVRSIKGELRLLCL